MIVLLTKNTGRLVMKKQFLTGLATGLFLVGIAGSASALTFTNGSFETGSFLGWSANSSLGGITSVVTANAGFTATDGKYFANLTANSMLSSAQSWVAGETLSFDWNFNANDYLPFNDVAIFGVIDTGGGDSNVVTLADVASVGTSVNNYKATGWNTYEYTFATAGAGYIGFGVLNVKDDLNDSQLYIDNVGGSTPVPEPTTMLLFGAGLIGLVGYNRKRLNNKN